MLGSSPRDDRPGKGRKASSQPCAWLVGACTCCEGDSIEVEKETTSGQLAPVGDSNDPAVDPYDTGYNGKEADGDGDGRRSSDQRSPRSQRESFKAAAPCVPWFQLAENTQAHHRQEALLSASLALLVLITGFGTAVCFSWLIGLFSAGGMSTPCRDYDRPAPVLWDLAVSINIHRESSIYHHTDTTVAALRVLVALPVAVWLALLARTHHSRIVACFAVLFWAHQVLLFMYLLGLCDEAGWVSSSVRVGTFACFAQGLLYLLLFYSAALVLKHLATLETSALEDFGVRHLRWAVWWLGPFALFIIFATEALPMVPGSVPSWAFICWWVVVNCVACRSSLKAWSLAKGAAASAVSLRAEEARRGVRALRKQLAASLLALFSTLLASVLASLASDRLKPFEGPHAGTNGHATLYLLSGLFALLKVAANAYFALAMGGSLTGTDRNSALQADDGRRRRQRWSKAHSEWRRSITGAGHLASWDEKVHELAGGGIDLSSLLSFYRRLGGSDCMPHFEPARHTTTDVVRQAVIPMTADKHCSCASLLMNGQHTRPDKLVTHSWSNLFRDTVAAVIADALEDSDFSMIAFLLMQDPDLIEGWIRERGLGNRTYWLCAFAVNQHRTICNYEMVDQSGIMQPMCNCNLTKVTHASQPTLADGRSIHCETNKLIDMIQYLSALDASFEQIVAVDADYNLFTRAWCAAEIVAANNAGMRQRLKIPLADELHDHMEQLGSLKMDDMQSTVPEDKQQITKGIKDTDMFNRQLQSILTEDLVPACSRMDSEEQMVHEGRVIRWHQACIKRGLSPSLWDAGKR